MAETLFIRVPLTFVSGRMETCSLEESIESNVRLMIANPPQGESKPPGVAGDPGYGVDLPHHDFRHIHLGGESAGAAIRDLRNAIRNSEPRFREKPDGIRFVGSDRETDRTAHLVRVRGTAKANDKPLDMYFEIEL